MNYFTSGLKTVLGAQPAGPVEGARVDEGAETVEKLVERLQNSTLLEDRRGACRALRSLSKKYRIEVGAQGMDALVNVLTMDRMDNEMVAYALECLLNITQPEPLEDEDPNMAPMGPQFTEILTKKTENVQTLLSILDDYDSKVRLPGVKLMTNLLKNRPKDIQETLLVSPMGTSKLVDLLSDPREYVRNEALLLLTALTKGNANIQKIIAFENGFDRVIQIIESEGFSDGGPIVEDSLHLFLNLLKGNTSNQTFFREGSYVKKLLPFFSQPDESDGWATQKMANVYHMLQVVRTLVSPLNPMQQTLACQKSMKACGILQSLCSILMANGVPAETLTEAIVTVGECIRGCPENQEYFASVIAPSDPPRPALLILLMTLVSERQLLSLRCAVLYCVECYLHKNERSQAEFVSTLLPATDEAPTLSSGQLLCSALFSKDTLNNWFAAAALFHAIADNPREKENLLKVQLATKSSLSPVTILQQIVDTIHQSGKTQVKIALLQFVSVWLESSPAAITVFLSYQNSVPYLITQITAGETEGLEIFIQGLSAFVLGLCLHFNTNTVPSFTKEKLMQLVTNRIGLETLTEGLNHISKSEFYLHSLKHPQVNAKHSSDLVFDHAFCLLFKRYEHLILAQLSSNGLDPPPVALANNDFSKMGLNHHNQSANDVINSYKEVIRRQDESIDLCKKEISALQLHNLDYKSKVEDMLAEVMQLKNQLALAQAQRESFSNVRQIPEEQHLAIVFAKDALIKELESRIEMLSQSAIGNSASTVKMAMQEDLISKLEDENKQLVEEVDRMKKDQEELLELLTEQDNRISALKGRLRELGAHVEEDEDAEDELVPANMVAFDDAAGDDNILQ